MLLVLWHDQIAYFFSAIGAPALVTTTAMPALCPFCLSNLNYVWVAVVQKNVLYRDLPSRLSRKMLKIKEAVLGCSRGH